MQNAFYGHKNLYDCVSTDCSISCITEITNLSKLEKLYMAFRQKF